MKAVAVKQITRLTMETPRLINWVQDGEEKCTSIISDEEALQLMVQLGNWAGYRKDNEVETEWGRYTLYALSDFIGRVMEGTPAAYLP